MAPKNAPQQPSSRRERRAAENRDRFDAARDARRHRAAARTGGGGGGSNIGKLTVAGLVVGVLVIAVVALGQFGGTSGDDLVTPAVEYPAGIVDGTALGNADAPVVLEVFEDLQCPFCANYTLAIEPVIVSEFVNNGTLRIVHRDLAFLGDGTANDESVLAGSAAACALDQDRYITMTHWIYENQDGENRGGFRRERLDAIAEAAGLDMAAYTACMDDPATANDVRSATTEIRSLGVNSTPSMRINGGQIQVGLSVDELRQQIRAAAGQ